VLLLGFYDLIESLLLAEYDLIDALLLANGSNELSRERLKLDDTRSAARLIM